MFGWLFESKKEKQIKDMSDDALNSANKLSTNVKKKISFFLLKKIIKNTKEYKGLANPSAELDEVVKAQVDWVGEMRRSFITIEEDSNPNWVQYCILESYMHALCYGKKTTIYVCEESIMPWIKENIPEKELKKYHKDIKKIIADFIYIEIYSRF